MDPILDVFQQRSTINFLEDEVEPKYNETEKQVDKRVSLENTGKTGRYNEKRECSEDRLCRYMCLENISIVRIAIVT